MICAWVSCIGIQSRVFHAVVMFNFSLDINAFGMFGIRYIVIVKFRISEQNWLRSLLVGIRT